MNFGRAFLDFFYPCFCVVCDKEGDYLCPDCFSKIKIFSAPFCPYCKSRSFDGRICKRCLSAKASATEGKKSLSGFVAAASYKEKEVRKIIDTFKYNFVKELAKPLAFLILKFLAENPEIEFFKNPLDFLILPIPLHSRRLRWRGFNQAEEIGKELVSLLKIPMKNDVLSRTRYTKPQVRLGTKERKENVKNAFEITKRKFIKGLPRDREAILRGKKIILLDDVATSLSTLEEAAKVLKENGAKEVWGLVAAKG